MFSLYQLCQKLPKSERVLKVYSKNTGQFFTNIYIKDFFPLEKKLQYILGHND